METKSFPKNKLVHTKQMKKIKQTDAAQLVETNYENEPLEIRQTQMIPQNKLNETREKKKKNLVLIPNEK